MRTKTAAQQITAPDRLQARVARLAAAGEFQRCAAARDLFARDATLRQNRNMRISSKELIGLVIGAMLGASPFVLFWWFFGRNVQPFETSNWLFGIPIIFYAPFAALLGAIVGVAIIGRK